MKFLKQKIYLVGFFSLILFLFFISQVNRKNVCIIGGGVSGIVSLKSALETGLKPALFEKEESLKGIWNKESGYTWDTMKTNLSKYSCMFSDFRWPKHVAMFPSPSEMNQYLDSYIEHFKLNRYIQCSSKVINISPFKKDRWKVLIERGGKQYTRIFDHVIVASGLLSNPSKKLFLEQDFRGKVIHSKDYKSKNSFKDKNVLVIGGSFSGAEIASDLVGTASSIKNIVLKKSWILPRLIKKDQQELPVDLFSYIVRKNDNTDVLSGEYIKKRNRKFQEINRQSALAKSLSIKDDENANIIISDDYLNHVSKGNIEVYNKEIKKIESNLVELCDGTQLYADVIILCTGYVTQLPFIESSLLNQINFEGDNSYLPLNLYKATFHPKMKNVAFVGLFNRTLFTIIELQARWACLAFKHPSKYYPEDHVMEPVIDKVLGLSKRKNKPQYPYGDPVKMADEIAQEINVLPPKNLLNTLKNQKKPMISSYYRLQGPFKNKKVAKKIIVEVDQELYRMKNANKNSLNY